MQAPEHGPHGVSRVVGSIEESPRADLGDEILDGTQTLVPAQLETGTRQVPQQRQHIGRHQRDRVLSDRRGRQFAEFVFRAACRTRNSLQAFRGRFDIGRQIRHDESQRVARLLIVGRAYRYGNTGRQRPVRQLTDLTQIAPQRAAADREHDIVDGNARVLRQAAELGQRVQLGGIAAL